MLNEATFFILHIHCATIINFFLKLDQETSLVYEKYVFALKFCPLSLHIQSVLLVIPPANS